MSLLKALACQLLAMILVLMFSHGLLPLSLWVGLGAQAVLAAGLSRLIKQAVWWQWIHLGFAPAAVAGLSLHVASWVYLAALLILTLVFWGTLKGDVPLFLSSPAVSFALADLLERQQAVSCVDIGAGIGTVVVPLADALPTVSVAAWEKAPLPWLIAAWRCRHRRNVQVLRRSLWDCDLGEYDLVFAFLSPLVMSRLAEKARQEMRPGSLLVSSSFPIIEWSPEQVLTLADRRQTQLFCYRLPVVDRCYPERL